MAHYPETSRASREIPMKLKVVAVLTEMPNNYAAYVPDLPGCISTGKTWEKMLEMIQECLEFHIEGMMLNGDPLPERYMSMEEAMAYHCEPISEEELEELSKYDFPPTLSVTFKEIEVEVDVPAPAEAARTVPLGA